MEGEPVSALFTPALVVDVDKVKRNAQRMRERCHKLGVQLRPHMKTHKTLECADIMTGGSRQCIVVSTLAEASFYADHGFDDILYAYCLPLDKVLSNDTVTMFHIQLYCAHYSAMRKYFYTPFPCPSMYVVVTLHSPPLY
ncbi:hypothetical protein ATANTOWER_029732 [Ataeniobius toweri]|uniref:Alanine racemase N-terminal domain-containing protein n=1 Tax=Ataeniobius toweri TaxID=208326 RepID=A0ABU7BM25_9TELE|nr:hypothetical protein [Ataeniobius toweri]